MDQLYQIALTFAKGIGPATIRKLINHSLTASNVFKESAKSITSIHGIGNNVYDAIQDKDILLKAENELKFCQKHQIEPIFFTDQVFSKKLNECPDGPVLLYKKGSFDVNKYRVLSIVGTRKATERAREFCNSMLEDASKTQRNLVVVSGLAYGVDIAAHHAALKNKFSNIAALAHDLSRIYPPGHAKYAQEIIENGLLLTEFNSQHKFEPGNFVRRNRIIAGLCDVLLVVESDVEGGSMISARLANDYNREVVALPGRYTDTVSKGCNFLIKKQMACLIESWKDIEQLMNWEPVGSKKAVQTELFPKLTEDEQKIYDVLSAHDQIDVDSISMFTSIPMGKLSALLLSMEFAGIVKSLPGKMYKV